MPPDLSSTRVGWLKDLDDAFSSFRKPILAAVRGFAVSQPGVVFDDKQLINIIYQLGGGFELALMVSSAHAYRYATADLPGMAPLEC